MLFPIPMQVTGVPESKGRIPGANPLLIALTVVVSLVARPEDWWVGPGTGPLSVLSYAFLHAGWAHLLLNMWVLWVVGNPVNRRLGDGWYLAVYLGSALAVGLAARLLCGVPVVGASGAIFAVTAVALVLMPRARVEVHYLALLPVTLLMGLVRRPKYPLFWFARWGVAQLTATWCLLLVPLAELAGWLAALPWIWHWSHLAHLLGFACGIAAVLLLPRQITIGRRVVYS